MKVAKDTVVSLAYQVRTEDGVLVDEATTAAPLDYLHGRGALIAGLEKALEGRSASEAFDVFIPANEAYGTYDDNLVQRVPREVFVGVDELEAGMRFLADTDQGPVPVEITEVGDDYVVVDGNHMLAGQNLNFHVEIVALREPTEEELEHGHVHAAQGGCCGGGHGEGGCCGCGHGHDHGEGECCGGGHGHDHGEGECCGGGHGHDHGEGECCGGGKGQGQGHNHGGCGCGGH